MMSRRLSHRRWTVPSYSIGDFLLLVRRDMDEDADIARSWITVTNNSIVGTDQKAYTFFDSIC